MKFYTLAAVALLGVAHAEGEDKPKEGDDKKPAAAAAGSKCTPKFAFFADKTCTKADDTKADDAVKKQWNDLAGALADCKAVEGETGKFVQTKCDTEGISTAKYTDDKCTTLDKVDDKEVKPTAITWGACVEKGDISFKVTGAKALMVATTAALALVGSQF